ncbi:MFS transporter [Actinocrispum sp. NPDC049592]|uniref:MFS transporter n=1 Tax=Actinocrispum sp. NPDC049592 TaxID=3154835 RepID=UPI0034208202
MFVDLLGFTLVLPALPFTVTQLGGGGLWLGVLMTGYSLAQAIAAPILGRLADRHGRRQLLLVSLAGSAISLGAMGLAGSLWLLLAARVFAGACGGSIGVAQAFAVDIASPQRRTKAIGLIGAATGLAFTIGPALGSLAAPLGFSTTAGIAAALAMANLIMAWRTLPRSTPRPIAPSAPAPPQWLLLVAGFSSMAAFVGMETTLAFLVAFRFGGGPGVVGVLLCLAGLVMTLVQATGVAAAARRWGDRGVAVTGALTMALGLPFLPTAPIPIFVGAVALLAAGQGLVTTTLASMLAVAGPPETRGTRMGQGQAAASAARMVGPVTAGVLFDVTVWLPYALGTAFSVATAAAVTRARTPAARTS